MDYIWKWINNDIVGGTHNILYDVTGIVETEDVFSKLSLQLTLLKFWSNIYLSFIENTFGEGDFQAICNRQTNSFN